MPPSKLVPVPAGSASGAGGMTPTGPEKPQRSYPSDQEQQPQAVTSKKSSNSRVRFQDPEVDFSPLMLKQINDTHWTTETTKGLP